MATSARARSRASDASSAARASCAPSHCPSLLSMALLDDKALGEIVVSEEDLRERIAALGKEITDDYRGRAPLLVGVLKGAFMFRRDLALAVHLPVEVDFIAVSSY